MTTWTGRALLVSLAILVLAVPPAGAQNTLFNNNNPAGVLNNPPQPTVFTLGAPATITQIVTYHWNNGRGAPPGQISLRSQTGQTFGPFRAQGSSGQGGAPNVNWTATVNVAVPAGTYTVVDSDAATWSHNPQSGSRGFAIVYGRLAQAGAPPPTIPLPPGVRPPTRPPVTPPPTAGFRPCFVNTGAVAAMGPCSGPRGTPITIQVLRRLQAPILRVVFKPYQVPLPGAVGAQVIATPSGNGTAVGSLYRLAAPPQLCISGGGSWDAFPIDARGQNLGDIGRFTVTGCP